MNSIVHIQVFCSLVQFSWPQLWNSLLIPLELISHSAAPSFSSSLSSDGDSIDGKLQNESIS